MIYTVIQNPASNRTAEVEEIIYDDVNEVIERKQCWG